MTADGTPQPPRLYGKTCSRCREAEPGPGGILCDPCRRELESAPLYPEPAKEVTP